METVFTGDTYAAELEGGYLTIHRWSDEKSVTRPSRGLVADFRSYVASHGVDRACATYLRIIRPDASEWVRLYKCPLADALGAAYVILETRRA